MNYLIQGRSCAEVEQDERKKIKRGVEKDEGEIISGH